MHASECLQIEFNLHANIDRWLFFETKVNRVAFLLLFKTCWILSSFGVPSFRMALVLTTHCVCAVQFNLPSCWLLLQQKSCGESSLVVYFNHSSFLEINQMLGNNFQAYFQRTINPNWVTWMNRKHHFMAIRLCVWTECHRNAFGRTFAINGVRARCGTFDFTKLRCASLEFIKFLHSEFFTFAFAMDRNELSCVRNFHWRCPWSVCAGWCVCTVCARFCVFVCVCVSAVVWIASGLW